MRLGGHNDPPRINYLQKAQPFQKNLESWIKGCRQIQEIKRIGFSVECFRADFLQFYTKKRSALGFGWLAGYSLSNPSISRIFLKFPYFLRSQVLSCLSFTFF